MIGTDLFQLLTLVLLFLTLLTLLGALSVLNAIKRDLASGSGARSDTTGAVSSAGYGSSALSAQEPAAGYAPSSSYAPAPTSYEPAPSAYESTTSSYEPLASSSPATQEPEVETGFVSMTEAVSEASSPSVSSGSSFGAMQLRGDEPEEQPFERDGRWWFKRGDELLVYDEGTGQWVAPPGAGAASAPATTGSFAPTATATQSDVGEGWKCSSCGAINGSTATSCRLCFAPR